MFDYLISMKQKCEDTGQIEGEKQFHLLNTISRIIQVSPELLLTLRVDFSNYPIQFLGERAGAVHLVMGVDDPQVYIRFTAKFCLHNRLTVLREVGVLSNIQLFQLEEILNTDTVQLYLSPVLQENNGKEIPPPFCIPANDLLKRDTFPPMA